MAIVIASDELAEVTVISANGITKITQPGSSVTMSNEDFNRLFDKIAKAKSYKKSWLSKVKQEISIKLRLTRWL